MKVLIFLLLACVSVTAQTVEEQYVMQSEAMLDSTANMLMDIEQGFMAYATMMLAIAEAGKMSEETDAAMAEFYRWITGKFLPFYKQRIFTASQEMQRLKAIYQRSAE